MQKLRLRKILLELVMILFTVIYMFPVMNLVFSSLNPHASDAAPP